MKPKAFSIIEIIFTLALISIILIVAVPKVGNIFANSYKTQIKTTITLIRKGIVQQRDKLLLANSLDTLDSLDEGGEQLFSTVLQTPIVESITPKGGSWIRVEENSYKVFIDDKSWVVFTYDPDSYSFDCDFTDILCKELTN